MKSGPGGPSIGPHRPEGSYRADRGLGASITEQGRPAFGFASFRVESFALIAEDVAEMMR
jgi:hypothetical protein